MQGPSRRLPGPLLLTSLPQTHRTRGEGSFNFVIRATTIGSLWPGSYTYVSMLAMGPVM